MPSATNYWTDAGSCFLRPNRRTKRGGMTLRADFDLDDFVQRVLAEDLGTGGDVTSAATIPADAGFTAEMNCREPIVVAGLEIAAAFFRELDPGVSIELRVSDGDKVEAGAGPMGPRGKGPARLAPQRAGRNTPPQLFRIA